MTAILMVEDSPTNATLYAAFLEQAGYEVRVADTGKAALSALEDIQPDLLLLDLQLPDMNGLDLLEKMSEQSVFPPTIVLTGNGSVRAAASAMRAGALDFLMKPCSAEKLLEAVASGLERFDRPSPKSPVVTEPKREGRSAKRGSSKPGPSGFFGQSHSMENVFSLIEAAARSSASVFITGESGTGKELCAQAIHKASPRHNGPFVPLNCAAIPRELIESEIFGHRKGSFTGAVQDREGAASLADGGTLFLDEICEMELDLQSKLLRFIQTGTYRRVGDGNDRQTDIRFVCATNRDPYLEVQAGRFREDLYYRLHVVPIVMPPLRDRGSDIRKLAERFLKDFSVIEGKSFTGFDDDALRVIEYYSWPGNVRQLENTIRNIVVLHDGPLVRVSLIPALPGARGPAPSSQATPSIQTTSVAPTHQGGGGMHDPSDGLLMGPDGVPPDRWFVRPIEELEMMAIEAAIRSFDGNVTQAAKALNISTSSIYRKKNARDEQNSG